LTRHFFCLRRDCKALCNSREGSSLMALANAMGTERAQLFVLRYRSPGKLMTAYTNAATRYGHALSRCDFKQASRPPQQAPLGASKPAPRQPSRVPASVAKPHPDRRPALGRGARARVRAAVGGTGSRPTDERRGAREPDRRSDPARLALRALALGQRLREHLANRLRVRRSLGLAHHRAY